MHNCRKRVCTSVEIATILDLLQHLIICFLAMALLAISLCVISTELQKRWRDSLSLGTVFLGRSSLSSWTVNSKVLC